MPTKDEVEVTTGNEQNKGVQATEERHPDAHWYALQVYSGHENKVRNLLDKRIAENTNPNEIFHQVRYGWSPSVPTAVQAGR